jgi:hypothetical protein
MMHDAVPVGLSSQKGQPILADGIIFTTLFLSLAVRIGFSPAARIICLDQLGTVILVVQ